MQQGETQQEEEDFSWENEGSQFLKQRIFSLPRFPPFLTPLVCPDIRMNGKLFVENGGRRRRTKNNNHRPPPPNPSRPLFLLFLSAPPPFPPKWLDCPLLTPFSRLFFFPFFFFSRNPSYCPEGDAGGISSFSDGVNVFPKRNGEELSAACRLVGGGSITAWKIWGNQRCSVWK